MFHVLELDILALGNCWESKPPTPPTSGSMPSSRHHRENRAWGAELNFFAIAN